MQAHLPTETIQLTEIIDTSIKQMQWDASARNIKIIAKEKGKIPQIMGDKNELTQVFCNLIGNSIKYGDADSSITVTIQQSELIPKDAINYRSLKKAISVTIVDQGKGIPEEHIPRLTERFYRVDQGRSGKVKGTGLGLAIVKHILKRHQGALSIESTVGKGSTFTVFLPWDT